jgi:hypothetical protein
MARLSNAEQAKLVGHLIGEKSDWDFFIESSTSCAYITNATLLIVDAVVLAEDRCSIWIFDLLEKGKAAMTGGLP